MEVTLQSFRLQTAGLRGEFEALVSPDGRLESQGVSGRFSLPTDSLHSGNRLFDRDMKKMLEIRKYPEITGEILDVKADDANGGYQLRGNLTLHGVRNEVTGRARVVELGDGHALIEGAMTLDFTHFKLDPPKLLILKVMPELEIWGHVYAERQP